MKNLKHQLNSIYENYGNKILTGVISSSFIFTLYVANNIYQTNKEARKMIKKYEMCEIELNKLDKQLEKLSRE